MKERASQVKAYVPEYLKQLLVKLAAERGLGMSELLGNMIIREVTNGTYEELTKTEKHYVALKEREIETDMLKFIRSKTAEKMHFLRNIKKQMYLFTLHENNGRDIDKKDIIENMKVNLQIAQANKWNHEVKKIKEFLKKVKSEDFELDQNTRMIEVHPHETRQEIHRRTKNPIREISERNDKENPTDGSAVPQ